MPLTVNVGLSRKASKDYQSSGASVNFTAELDQALLARPKQLQTEVQRLYQQAEAALELQANHTAAPGADRAHPGNGSTAAANSAGNSRPTPTSGGRAATAAQRKAIDAIARRLGLDVAVECRDELGVELDDLDIKNASALIDHLKSLQGNIQGATR